jgi:thymidylate synthase
MIKVIEGQGADEVWQQAMSELRSCEQILFHNGRGGTTRELLHTILTLRDPRQRWIVTRNPALNPAFAIAEIVWILNGRKDSAFLNYWNAQLPKYAGNGREYHGAYGYRLRSHFGMDQLQRAYQALRNNPDGRQVVLQIWDPASDFPNENGQPVNADIPCNISSLLKVRDRRLEWMQIMRSNDVFRGLPYNIIQFTSLQEILAGWLGVELGSYNHLSDSLHLYESDAKLVTVNVADRIEPNTDSLCLSKEASDAVFAKANELVEAMTKPRLSQDELYALLTRPGIPVAFKNLLSIVAAEAARKRGWMPLAQALADESPNPVLKQAWKRWLARFQ